MEWSPSLVRGETEEFFFLSFFLLCDPVYVCAEGKKKKIIHADQRVCRLWGGGVGGLVCVVY